MKWLVLLAIVCLLAVPVAGTQLTFQDPGEYATYATCVSTGGGFCTYTYSSNGGNSYLFTQSGVSPNYAVVALNFPQQTTYAAATLTRYTWNFGAGRITIFDAGGVSIYTFNLVAPGYTPARYEVIMSGGAAYLYRDGIHIATSTAISNPSFVGFGSYSFSGGAAGNGDWDDYVLGTSENRYIFSAPEEGFYIKKDLINPASAGFYYPNGSTLVSSNNMTTTWAKGGDNTSIKVKIENVFTGYEACNVSTTAGRMSGSVVWDIRECFTENPNTPYGLYYVTSSSAGGSTSTRIEYKGDGATVSFDKDDYSRQETAHISYEVLPGGYWNTALYAYRMDVISATTGAVVHTDPLTMQTGTVDYTFTDTDDQGTYYAAIIATRDSDGEEIWMNVDWADLSGTLSFNGYVNDGESELPISGANVTFSQDNIVSTTITIADGNYTASGMVAGGTITINVTATGYHQYYVNLVPAQAKSVTMNITLNSTSPTYSGLGVGGIVRDGILTGNTITKGYGRPVPDAGVIVTNESNGEYYGKTTNAFGWYLCDEGATCTVTNVTAEQLSEGSCGPYGGGACEGFSDTTAATVFTQDRLYTIFANKLGYLKSQNYTVMFS